MGYDSQPAESIVFPTPPCQEAIAPATELRTGLIAAEREYIYRMLQEGKITDEARRRIERELDLEEESLAFKRASAPDPPLQSLLAKMNYSVNCHSANPIFPISRTSSA
jgi:hypothetical protein